MRRGFSWLLPAAWATVAGVASMALRADPPRTPAAVTGRIDGRVFDPQGRPAVGVQVVALPGPRPASWGIEREVDAVLARAPDEQALPLAATATGVDGTFTFVGLDPHRVYRVRADPAPPWAPSSRVARAEPEPVGSVGLYLARGAPLDLRVVDARGAGVRGRVSLRTEGSTYLGSDDVAGHEGGWSLLDVPTAVDGALRLEAVPAGRCVLTFVAAGHAAATRTVITPADGVLTLALGDAQGAGLAGAVRDEEGLGIAGARLVWAAGAHAARTLVLATCDAGGRFRLDALPVGTVRLARVEAPGHVLPQVQALRLNEFAVVGGAVATAEIRLERACSVTGGVRDAAGAPVADAQVSLELAGILPTRVTRTDAAGRFAFADVPRGRGAVTVDGLEPLVPLRVAPDHFRPGATARVELARPGTAVELDLRVRLGRLPDIVGTVRDADGESVAGAVVTATRLLQTNEPTPTASVSSDAEGRFVIRAPATWPRWNLRAAHAGRSSPDVDVQLGQASIDLVVGTRRRAALSGQVVGADGAPLSGAEVTPCAERSSFGQYSGPTPVGPSVVTDAEGRFRLGGLEEWRVTLHVRHRGVWLHRLLRGMGGEDELLWHDLAEGDLEGVRVEVLPTGAIAGTVVDEQGLSVAGVEVELTLVNAGIGVLRRTRVASDAAGRFEAPYLVAGDYALTLGDDADEEQGGAVHARTGSRDVILVQRARVQPTPDVRLTGTLRDADGAPVAVAFLEVGGAATLVGPGARVVDGAFTLALRVEPGEAWLTVRDAHDAAGEPLLRGYERFPLPAQAQGPITLRLPALRVVAGRVVDEAGGPVAGVIVQLTDDGPLEERGLEWHDGPWMLTDAAGAFAFRGYEWPLLRVRPEGDWMEPGAIDVRADSTEPHVVVLRRGARIAGVATNADGEPRRASLSVTWAAPTPGKLPPLSTDDRGRFLCVVPAGARGVMLRADEGPALPIPMRLPGRPFAVLRDVEPGRTDLVLRMTAGDVIRGKVVGPAGEPVGSGWVLLVPDAAPARAEGPAPFLEREPYAAIRAGRFALTGAPDGPCRLIAIPEGEEFSPSEIVAASAPCEGIELCVPRSVPVSLELAGGAGAGPVWFATWAGATASGRPLWRSASSDAASRLRLLLPPTGGGTLYARNPDDDRYALVEGLVASAPPQAPLPLHAGLSLKGRVEGLGAGEAQGSLLRLKGPQVTTSAWLAPDATFHVRGLPPGRYEAEVEVPAAASFEFRGPEGPPHVQAGDQDVVLRSGIRRIQRR